MVSPRSELDRRTLTAAAGLPSIVQQVLQDDPQRRRTALDLASGRDRDLDAALRRAGAEPVDHPPGDRAERHRLLATLPPGNLRELAPLVDQGPDPHGGVEDALQMVPSGLAKPPAVALAARAAEAVEAAQGARRSSGHRAAVGRELPAGSQQPGWVEAAAGRAGEGSAAQDGRHDRGPDPDLTGSQGPSAPCRGAAGSERLAHSWPPPTASRSPGAPRSNPDRRRGRAARLAPAAAPSTSAGAATSLPGDAAGQQRGGDGAQDGPRAAAASDQVGAPANSRASSRAR